MLGMNRRRLRSRTGLKALPPELLLKVHRLLPVRDLKTAVLVNKAWNRVGEDPFLWSWAVVRVNNREDIAKLSVRRLARLREIQIALKANLGNADWKLFFQNVEKLAKVKDIRGLRYRDLKGVDSDLLARALKVVENVELWGTELTLNVELWGTELTSQQFTSIFNLIAIRNTKIKKLELVHQNLKAVCSRLLARALNELEDVGLWGSLLTSQQITSIFSHIAVQDTKINKLELGGQDLSVVPMDDLSVAVSKLERVELSSTRLTTAQVNSIMLHIVQKQTKIKILSLLYNDLSVLDGNLLNRAKNKLSQSGGIIVH